jgi:hypothetical protein
MRSKNYLRPFVASHYPNNTLIMPALKNTIKQLHLLSNRKKRMSLQHRKDSTRRKIQMGGLIIKAGLGEIFDTSPEIILGLLCEGYNNLHGKEKEDFHMHYTLLGKKEFG